MTSGLVGQLVAVILLVPLAGVFAAADAAISSVSRARVDGLVREGATGAKALAAVVADRPRHLNLLVLLRLACEAAAYVLGAFVALQLIGPDWLALLVAGLVVVLVSYVLIGVGPRTLGRQHSYGMALAVAPAVRLLVVLLGPLASLLIIVGNAITPGVGFREGPFSSEVELRELVDMAERGGLVDDDERAMIQSVFDLGDTRVLEVMVPRTEMVWIERDKSVRQALALALRSGYSRIPVIGKDVDDTVGVVYLKDLVRRTVDSDAPADRAGAVGEVMRPANFVPDSKRADALLRDMQRDRNHMALVVDEYGGTAGLVTIEDLLEEIVGEITDEYDAAEHRPLEHLDETTWRVAARLPVEDLEEATGVEFDVEDVDTVGGLLAQRLGRVPLPGAEAEIGGLRLRAEGGEDARGRMRIRSLLVWRQADEPAPAEDPATTTDDDARRADDTGRAEGDLAQTGARDGKDDRG
ncbi:CBS domain containing-hemolysin-like protein [Actinomycetospora succinea]|uniref:CBS domain containing-hemolysin-like protein n=1 Tax=Actinomycetospora succinea TaxID=663603 RepID=A0A4R6V1V9_9PSEU|nr:hemolysin family protein [Actinomycetospora succinea]TDQ53980.1 CBS domain containing-hemolysin-like protein [Actinomycetospora succinea]